MCLCWCGVHEFQRTAQEEGVRKHSEQMLEGKHWILDLTHEKLDADWLKSVLAQEADRSGPRVRFAFPLLMAPSPGMFIWWSCWLVARAALGLRGPYAAEPGDATAAALPGPVHASAGRGGPSAAVA